MSTSTFGAPLNTSRIIATRSSTVNSGVLSALTSTATMTRSKMAQPRSMMSTWPLVSGSNDPGRRRRAAGAWSSGSAHSGASNITVQGAVVRTRTVLSPAWRPCRASPAASGRGGVFERSAGRPARQMRPPPPAHRRSRQRLALVRRIEHDQVEWIAVEWLAAARGPAASRMITQRSRTPQRATFSAISATARRSCSTNTTRAAPRLRLSRPTRAGAGEHVEHARAGTRRARMLNSVSRSLSEVGRSPSQVGAFSRRPLFIAGDDAHTRSEPRCGDQPTAISPNCRCHTLCT